MSVSSVNNNINIGDWVQFSGCKENFKILSITSIGYRLLGNDGQVYQYNNLIKVLTNSQFKFITKQPTVLTDPKKNEEILKKWRQENGVNASKIDTDTRTFCEKTKYFSLIKNEIVDSIEKKTTHYEYSVYSRNKSPSPAVIKSNSASPSSELEGPSLFRSIAVTSPTSEMRDETPTPVSELSSPRTETSMSISPSLNANFEPIEARYDEILRTTVYTV